MPTYQYRCVDCNFLFEERQSFMDTGRPKCPKCRGACERVICPTTVIYKCKGFYTTDSRGPGGGDE